MSLLPRPAACALLASWNSCCQRRAMSDLEERLKRIVAGDESDPEVDDDMD